MKIYKYNEIRASEYFKYFPKIISLKSELRTILQKEYKSKQFETPLSNQISKLLYVAKGDLSRKRLLDLGCGSNNHQLEGLDIFDDRMFEPWLCRGLYEIGLDPIGIDHGSLSDEKFEHYQMNLLNERLDFIPDSSIDIVNASELFNSPFLNHKLKDRGGKRLMDILLPQIKRIVKPSGCFIYSTD